MLCQRSRQSWRIRACCLTRTYPYWWNMSLLLHCSRHCRTQSDLCWLYKQKCANFVPRSMPCSRLLRGKRNGAPMSEQRGTVSGKWAIQHSLTKQVEGSGASIRVLEVKQGLLFCQVRALGSGESRISHFDTHGVRVHAYSFHLAHGHRATGWYHRYSPLCIAVMIQTVLLLLHLYIHSAGCTLTARRSQRDRPKRALIAVDHVRPVRLAG